MGGKLLNSRKAHKSGVCVAEILSFVVFFNGKIAVFD